MLRQGAGPQEEATGRKTQGAGEETRAHRATKALFAEALRLLTSVQKSLDTLEASLPDSFGNDA